MRRPPYDPGAQPAGLLLDLHQQLTLEGMLQMTVDRAAELLETRRVSVRLLDATRSRLLAICRAGAPLHVNPMFEFRLGEGLIGWIAHQAMPIRTGDAERDGRFLHRPDMTERMGSFLGVPLLSSVGCIGVLSAVHPEPDYFRERHEELLVSLAELCVQRVEVARLMRLSQIDPLTGALNRRGLELVLPESGGPDGPLSLAACDLEELARLQEQYGKEVSDAAVRRAARGLLEGLRAGDALVRHKELAFLLVFPKTGLEAGAERAERARRAVAACSVPLPGEGELELTLKTSVGVAERRAKEPRDALIERAEEAARRAREVGAGVVERG